MRLVPSSAIILQRHGMRKRALYWGIPKHKSGREGKIKAYLRVFNVNINLFLDDKVPFEKFEKTVLKAISPIAKLLLPFSFHYDKFYEVEVIREEINEEQAYQNTLKCCINNWTKK